MGVLISAEAADKITVYQSQNRSKCKQPQRQTKYSGYPVIKVKFPCGLLCLNTCVPGAVSVGHKEPCWRKWGCQRIALRLHSLATSCLCHSRPPPTSGQQAECDQLPHASSAMPSLLWWTLFIISLGRGMDHKQGYCDLPRMAYGPIGKATVYHNFPGVSCGPQ